MATVSTLTSNDFWTLTLGSPAEVEGGVVMLTPAALIPGSAYAGSFTTLVASGDATIGGTLGVTGLATASGGLTVLGTFDATSGLITTNGGTGAVTLGNGAGTVTANSDLTAGPAIVVDLSAAATLRIPAASPINTYALQIHIKDITAANAIVGSAVVPLGGAGTIVQAIAAADATIADGDLVLTGAIGAVAITNGVITIADGSAARTTATATPTATNVVAAGNVINFTVGGGDTAPGTATITVTIRRAAP